MLMKKNKNWVKIKATDYYTIIKKYREKIYDDGYNLTIDEMSDYLRCTYNYVQSQITPKLSYIVINSVARNLLSRAVRDDLLEYSTLYSKRRLYKRYDFAKYIYSAQVIKKYHRIYMTDLSDDAQKFLKMLQEKRPEKSVGGWFRVLAKRSHDAAVDAEQVYTLQYFPQTLLSLQDIKVVLNLNYDVQAYRYLDKIAAPKIKIGSLIRYDQADLTKTPPLYALPCNCDKQEFLKDIEERIFVALSDV